MTDTAYIKNVDADIANVSRLVLKYVSKHCYGGFVLKFCMDELVRSLMVMTQVSANAIESTHKRAPLDMLSYYLLKDTVTVMSAHHPNVDALTRMLYETYHHDQKAYLPKRDRQLYYYGRLNYHFFHHEVKMEKARSEYGGDLILAMKHVVPEIRDIRIAHIWNSKRDSRRCD